MTTIDKQTLTGVLQQHVSNICNMPRDSYGTAQALYERTRTLAVRYFPEKALLLSLVDGSFAGNSAVSWDDLQRQLLTISHSMLDELQLGNASHLVISAEFQPGLQEMRSAISEIRQNNIQLERQVTWYKRFVAFIICLALTSGLLWFFNDLVRWNWLSVHPKRIPLYLSTQLVMLFSCCLLITDNKKLKAAELGAIIISIILTLLTLL